jgi:hypothetical protein
MKKSDLKELIRKNIIQELESQDDDAALGNMYSPLYEKKKEEEEDIEITADEETEEPEVDMGGTEDPALSDADQEYLNTLETLKNKAKEMGDEKLENQIDNTITYFTRQHVVKEGDTDYARAKDAKRLGKKGEENIYGAGVKKGERLEKEKLQELDMESLNRMDELVNQNNLEVLVTAAQGIIKDLEEFEDDDIFDFIVSKIKTLDMSTPVDQRYRDWKPIRENYEMRRLQRIAGLI